MARGCGWQHLGAGVNLGSFYLFGIPIALLLGFRLHLRGWGLWTGIICGSTMQTVLMFILTGFINWERQVGPPPLPPRVNAMGGEDDLDSGVGLGRDRSEIPVVF